MQRKVRLGEVAPQTNASTMLAKADILMSKVNHRLYRQSRIYKVKIDIDGDLPAGTAVDVYALSDTWMNQKAYQMAKAAFDKNSAEELAALSENAKGRWHDFRVDDGFSGTVCEFVPEVQGAAANLLQSGEVELASVTDAAGTERTFRWVGSGGNTFNIIDEYDRSGNTDTSPTTASTSMAYQNLEDELDNAQVEHLSGDGNAPPYNANTIENEVFTRVARLYVDASGNMKTTTGYFHAPCGLVYLEGVGGTTSITLASRVTLEVQAGDYKGIAAENYLE